MASVTSMHEKMQQRAREQEEPRKKWDDVGKMLGEQEVCSDQQKHNQDDVCARRKESGFLITVAAVIHSQYP